METLYETDYVTWLDGQIEMIKQKDFQNLDIENLLEELEDLKAFPKIVIGSCMKIIIRHLLDGVYKPGDKQDAEIRKTSIWDHRAEIGSWLDDRQYLKQYPSEILNEIYEEARICMSKISEYELRFLPKDCPWTIEEVLGDL